MPTGQAPDLVGLGTIIRDQRRALGLTQVQLAERLGWTQERVSLLETGKYGLPSLPLLSQLAVSLRLPLSTVMAAAGFGIDGVPLEPAVSDEANRRQIADEMLETVAHDLRNQITPIKGEVDLLLRRVRARGEQQDAAHLAQISDALGRLSTMVSDLLDVSRVEGGIFSVVRRPVNIVDLVDDIVRGARSDRPEIELCCPERLIVEADDGRLRQALRNLVGNAVHHTPAGVPITVDMGRREEAGGTWAIVEVRDGGPGIDPEIMPHLFARHAAGGANAGTGLGLYLARGIARAHGGELTAVSEAGKGAAFILKLPMTGGCA